MILAIDDKRRFYRGSSNPNYKGRDLNRICVGCGRSFVDHTYTQQKYCDRQCKSENQKVRWTEAYAVQVIEQFSNSNLPLYQFAKSIGWSEFGLRTRLSDAAPAAYQDAMEGRRTKWDKVYRCGRQFEYETRKHLIANKYICMVSPRSMGPADLMAAKHGRILLVQCKTNGVMRPKDRTNLWDCAIQAGGVPVLAKKQFAAIELLELKDRNDPQFEGLVLS